MYDSGCETNLKYKAESLIVKLLKLPSILPFQSLVAKKFILFVIDSIFSSVKVRIFWFNTLGSLKKLISKEKNEVQGNSNVSGDVKEFVLQQSKRLTQ
jgi:hypothetical protein